MPQLVYWILGALLTVVAILAGIAHAAIMKRIDLIESRIGRIEDRLLTRGRT